MKHHGRRRARRVGFGTERLVLESAGRARRETRLDQPRGIAPKDEVGLEVWGVQ